jgi:hypothetical protein
VEELHQDLSTLLDLLLIAELGLADDVADLLALASHQCRRFVPAATEERALKARVLALIHGERHGPGTPPHVRPLLPPPARPQRASAPVPTVAPRSVHSYHRTVARRYGEGGGAEMNVETRRLQSGKGSIGEDGKRIAKFHGGYYLRATGYDPDSASAYLLPGCREFLLYIFVGHYILIYHLRYSR